MNSIRNICRVCLTQDDSGEMQSIFDNNCKIAFEIFLIAQIKITEKYDEMPALICRQCHNNLLEAITFRNKCRSSDVLFRENFSSIEEQLLKKFNEQEFKENVKEEQHIDLFEDIESATDNQINTELTEDNDILSEEIINSHESTQCTLCFKNFTSLHSLKDHMRAIHEKLEEKDMYRCEYCKKLYKMKYYLNRHMKSHHMKQVQKIKEKKEKITVKTEEVLDVKLTGLKCPYCPKYLTSKHSLNDHIKVKHEFINISDRFLCDICGKDFSLKYYLLRHLRASHLRTISYKKKENQSLPCSICGKILKNKGNLSTHEKTHRILTPDEYWYCDICGNKFKGRGEMTVHIKRQHLYKIRYPCEICPNKSWRTLFQLQRHVKVFHENIKEFKCEWCGKEFGEKYKLICHVRIHTGEQPFHCSYCNRKFTHQTDLRRHTWGHTGERPYKCQKENCEKGFMKKSELVAHGKRCHENKIS